MIKDQTLDEAIIEAARFIKAAKELRAARKTAQAVNGSCSWFSPQQAKEHAACKRASLDLTRKLADMRTGR